MKGGKTMKSALTLGADPEIFAVDGKGNLMPSFTFLPDQTEGIKLPGGSACYNDGYQAEFSVVPSSSVSKVVSSIRDGLAGVLAEARKKDPGAKLLAKPVVDIDPEYLQTLPDHLKNFGCMPSFNIYGIAGVGMPGSEVFTRFSGGHIHFGCGPQPQETTERMVRALDRVLGVACVSLFENIDITERRRHYGLASEHRLPKWGCEYRVLSNAWIYNPILAETMLDLSRQVMNFATSGRSDEWQTDDFETIETILLSDVEKARSSLERNSGIFKQFRIKNEIDFMKPAEQQLNMVDIEANWKLT
jgi:hypothetical protein